MYIKEIRINGFKSFADKTSIELSQDFTGIVGPNGSGKSNIVDAIKWVLGEQSVKNLRGTDGMTDVIFNGSKSRPQSNSASVSIVFDNTDHSLGMDYTEVMIKRVVYRTGENEYFLNNAQCRLKDITDLFLDHFTSKDSMNIIPQGQISEILSGKPEDRRTIFESAAGVLKYKKRKEEALRKLDKTHDNIERVDMIINELEVNIKPLEEQAEKAIKYKESSEKLKSIEVSLLTHDITENNLIHKNLLSKEETLKNKLVSLSNTNSLEESKLEKIKFESLKINENINLLQNKLMKINEELTIVSNKKTLAKERVKYDKDGSEIKNNLLNLKEESKKLENKLSEIKLSTLNDKEEENKLTEILSVLESEFNNANKKKDSLMEEYNALNRKEIETNNLIDILTENINNNSKLPFSVKSILDNPLLNGIYNTIGSSVETKKEYTTMLEVALGSTVNTVICENENSAKQAILYLRSNNKGRVTFFPMDVIKPRSIEPNIIKLASCCEGYVGICSDLVNYESKYYNIIMNVLGNIIVATDENSGVVISKAINRKYRIVTLTGDMIHVGGSLTGGSYKTTSGISDKYALEEQKDKLNNLLIEKDQLNKSIKDAEYDCNVLKDNIMKKNIDLIKAKEMIYSKEMLYKDTNEKLDEINFDIKDLSLKGKDKIDKNMNDIMNEFFNIEKEKNEIENKLDLSIKQSKNISEEIIEKENLIKKSNTFNTSINNELKDIEIQNTKINMIMDGLLTRLNEEYSLTYEKAKTEYIFEGDVDSSRKEVNELRKKIKSLGSINLGSIEEYERINKRYTFLTTQKADLTKSENNLLEIINDMDNVMINKFADTFTKINNEFNKVFTSLFNGGEAHLSLTDPKNMLETGIEITAYPPGKKPSVISLLSGGEKTLTAISLLFAIMNLKNVPFAILDEVESALDDVNVDKFGEYINSYKDKTQLLIITHKKKTMEFVNELYGVTMQESGVSKLVSVKLESI